MNRPSYKNKARFYRDIAILGWILLGFVVLGSTLYRQMQDSTPLITPIASKVFAYKVKEEVHTENMDFWVGKYVDKYFESNTQRSEMRMIMHCLLHRESGHQAHDENGPHGDSGKAGGSLQFHQPTWERMRNQMIKQGYAEEIGSRYDMEQAIETTVWAIKNGRGLEWGPILRASKNSNYAACQVPSWY